MNISEESPISLSLIGQPNVGKSLLFTRLTGVGVISSNYPGTTVEFDEGAICKNNKTIFVRDLPGIYGLSGNSDNEKIVIRNLYRYDNNAVILVVDQTNIENSLVLCFEVFELGIPSIVVLTKIDESRKRFNINVSKIESIFGVPVIPVSSKTSEGIDKLTDAICNGAAKIQNFKVTYDVAIEKAAKSIADGFQDDIRFDKRGTAIKILENSEEFIRVTDGTLHRTTILIRQIFKENGGESIDVSMASSRYKIANAIFKDCVQKIELPYTLSDKISDITINPLTGTLILTSVCFLILATIIYAGYTLDGAVSYAYDIIIGTKLIDLGVLIGGDFAVAVMSGIDGSFRAILSIIIPYIMVFYIILGILEDSGYLTRAVVHIDKMIHRFGLHGNAFIPIIVGLGCNVPAIMAVRTLRSRKEKIILSSIIAMSVPCSAQMAILMGVTGNYAGIKYSLEIFSILLIIAILMGLILNKAIKNEPSNLAIELPDLVIPSLKNILFKMWHRAKDFFYVAFPMLIVGSILVEIFLQYDLLDIIVDPLEPIVVDVLGLPAMCSIAFIVGMIRKEMAIGMLQIIAGGVALSDFMTANQFVVFGVVMAIYMPCIATVATMQHEIGYKGTATVITISMFVAMSLGGVINLILTTP